MTTVDKHCRSVPVGEGYTAKRRNDVVLNRGKHTVEQNRFAESTPFELFLIQAPTPSTFPKTI